MALLVVLTEMSPVRTLCVVLLQSVSESVSSKDGPSSHVSGCVVTTDGVDSSGERALTP